jgi:hypothetical protein
MKLDFVTIFTIIITNIVTLSGSFLAFKSNNDQTQTAFVQTTLNQVQQQSKEIVELRGLLLSAQIKIIDLESQLRSNVNAKELLGEFLDVLPFPAWVKRYDEESGQFIMILLNQQYTASFGYTENQYIGKSDFDIHNADLAESFMKADLKVLRSGLPNISHQSVVNAFGIKKYLYVYKFIIYLHDGSIGIAGVAIDIESASNSYSEEK